MVFTLHPFLCMSFHCLSVKGRSLSVCLPDFLFSSSEVLPGTSVSFPLPVSIRWLAREADGLSGTWDRNKHRWERLRSLQTNYHSSHGRQGLPPYEDYSIKSLPNLNHLCQDVLQWFELLPSAIDFKKERTKT